MSAFRLHAVSPVLAESFRRAPITTRRKAALFACEVAVSSVGLRDSEVLVALEALRSDAPLSPTVRGQLGRLAKSFDDEYLKLAEEGETRKPGTLKLFSKARAASALMFASSDDATQLHEAIYEAIESLDDPSELVRLMENILR